MTFNTVIYAIVRDTNYETLRLITQQISLDSKPSYKELCRFFNYASSLGSSYSSCLVEICRDDLEEDSSEYQNRLEALAFENTLKKLQTTYDVVAYSHRKGGWTGFNWEYNKDITFHISTNFGYGCVSYFVISYKYKNVLLCPYADYVKYQNTTVGTILSNTRSYQLVYEEWRYLMNETLDFYNAVVARKANYIIDWVNSNLRQMIQGLRNFVDYDEISFMEYKYQNGMRISTKATVKDDDFWILKSAKIANSVDFIENIKVLPCEFGASVHIQPLLQVCKDFLLRLNEKIEKLQNEIADLEVKKAEITSSELYCFYMRLHIRFYKPYKFYSKKKLAQVSFFFRALRRLKIDYDVEVIRRKLAILKDMVEEVSQLNYQLSDLKKLEGYLSYDASKISKFLTDSKE